MVIFVDPKSRILTVSNDATKVYHLNCSHGRLVPALTFQRLVIIPPIPLPTPYLCPHSPFLSWLTRALMIWPSLSLLASLFRYWSLSLSTLWLHWNLSSWTAQLSLQFELWYWHFFSQKYCPLPSFLCPLTL